MPRVRTEDLRSDTKIAIWAAHQPDTYYKKIRSTLQGLGTSRPKASATESYNRKGELLLAKHTVEDFARERNSSYRYPPDQEISYFERATDTTLDIERFIVLGVMSKYLSSPHSPELKLDQILTEAKHSINRLHLPRRYKKHLPPTIGVEIELGRPTAFRKNSAENREYLDAVDGLQLLGVPVTYDALRELPLPYSSRASEQLKAILSLMQAGILRPDHKFRFQVTTGNFRGDLHEHLRDIYTIPLILEVANTFGRPRSADGKKLLPSEVGRKPLSNSMQLGVDGLPFLLRNETTIEWRGLYFNDSFFRFLRGVFTLEDIMECFSAFSKKQLGRQISSAEELMAQFWHYFIQQAGEIARYFGVGESFSLGQNLCNVPELFRTALNDKTRTNTMISLLGNLYFSLPETVRNTYSRESLTTHTHLSYGAVRGELNRASHDIPGFREDMSLLLLELRQTVAEANKMT